MTKYIFLIAICSALIISCKKSGSTTTPTMPTGPTTPTAPTITSLSPDSGGYNTTVLIAGTNFSTTATSNTVTFNGAAATVSAATATQLTVTVPTGAGTGVVKVTVGANTATGPVFTYLLTFTVSTLAGPATFNDPFGIAVDTAGNVIVADDGNNQIKMVSPTGTVSLVAGSGTPGFLNGAATTAEFLDPPSVAVDPNDNILVADVFNYKIREISGGIVSTVAGTTQGEQNGGAVSVAQFDAPGWLAVDASDNIFVCDAYYIREVSGGSVSTIYNGQNYSSTLNAFVSIAVTNGDTLILTDFNGTNVWQLTTAGVFSSLAGSGSTGFQDGAGAAAYFSSCKGVSLDAHGNIVVADEANQRIRLITRAGVVTTIAGNGTAADQDGAGSTTAEFYYPEYVAVDKERGIIYVLEPMSNRIRKITAQ